jgi:toxin ParE1/3/4
MASAMLDAIERLGLFPKLGPVARDVRLRAQGYRYLSVERYLVFYKQVGADIVVYRVLHERQAYWRVLR